MKIGSKGRGPPAGGQFLPVSRGGTSSVVEAYTSRPRSLGRLHLIRPQAPFSTKKPPFWGGCANAVRKRSLGAAEPPHCLFSFNYFLRPIAPAAATRAITA